MSATRGKSSFFVDEPRPSELVTGPSRPPQGFEALRVVIVFQDGLMRDWAMQLWNRVSDAIRRQTFLVNTWRVGDLRHPLVLPEASAAAAQADMILVAVREWFEPPLEISGWVESWVPHRHSQTGSLAALIAVPAQEIALVSSAQQFFRSVAARAGLDFMPRQRALPQERIDLLDSRIIAQRANTTTNILSDILNQEQQSTRTRWHSC